MSTSDMRSDELKQIYRRVLKRVHPDLAVDELDRLTCERLTQEANAAYEAGDIAALKAVLLPKPVTHIWEPWTYPEAQPPSGQQEPPAPPPPQQPRQEAPPPEVSTNIWEPWTYTEARQPSRRQQTPPPPQQPRREAPPQPASQQPWRQPPQRAGVPAAPAFVQISNDYPKGLVVALAVGVLVVIGVLCVNPGNLRALSHSFSTTLQAAVRRYNGGAQHLQQSTVAPPYIVHSYVNPPTMQSYGDPSWVGCTRIGGGRSDSSRLIASVQNSLVNNLALWPVTGRTGIRFKLYQDGSVGDMTLDYPSGVVQRDSQAWASITRSIPFTEVAKDNTDQFSRPFVEVGCYFVFNSLNRPDVPRYQAPVSAAAVTGPDSEPGPAVLPKIQSTPAVTDFERQYPAYIEAVKSRVTQNFHSSEVIGNIPAGSTVFVQFLVGRDGALGNPTVKASSGYPSLDESCLRALTRAENFGKLPEGYQESSLKVLYHCTYPGSSVKSTPPPTQAAQSGQPETAPNKPSE